MVDSIIGIGLNINQESFKNLHNASSLKIETGENWDIQYILENLLVYINKGFKDLKDIDEKKLIDLYQTKLWKFKKKLFFIQKIQILKLKFSK